MTNIININTHPKYKRCKWEPITGAELLARTYLEQQAASDEYEALYNRLRKEWPPVE